MSRQPVNDHVRHDHKGQNPHQHERRRDGDDGCHHGVVAPVRAEQPAQSTPHPAWRPAYIHHSGLHHTLLHCTQVEVTALCHLVILTLFRQGQGMRHGGTGGRRVLQQQFALAALEADGQCPLHVGREFAYDVLVVAQARQVLAMWDLRQLAAHRAGESLELGGYHVDAGEALKTEGVPAHQQLWGLEDVVVGAEANSALSVLHVVFGGLHLPLVVLPFSPVSFPRLLTPPSLSPFPMVPLPFSPPPSFTPLRVDTPGSPDSCGLLLLPLALLAVLLFQAGFGLDVGGLASSMALVPPQFGPVSAPVIAHVGGMMSAVWNLIAVSQQELCKTVPWISSLVSTEEETD